MANPEWYISYRGYKYHHGELLIFRTVSQVSLPELYDKIVVFLGPTRTTKKDLSFIYANVFLDGRIESWHIDNFVRIN